MSEQKHTLLLGSYGRGNLGDDVFLVAAAELFRHHKLYINSANDSLLPESARGLVTTISTTSARDALKKFRVFLKVKNIVYWGGDVWVELYGDRFPRQSLYKMIALNTLARLFGKKIHYIGCGIGRLNGWSLWLARLSARLSHTLVARERRSAEVLGLAGVEVLPDLAINLPYYRPRLRAKPHDRPFVIGISLLYHVPDPAVTFAKLSRAIAQFINSLPAGKFKVVLLPMLISEHEPRDDLWASQQVLREVEGRTKVPVELHQAKNLQDMVETLGSFDLVVGTRLHANILATFNATPCLGIAYRAKVSSFFRDNGLGDYCIDLDSLHNLSAVFGNMYKNYKDVARQFYDASQRNIAQRDAYQKFAVDYE